MQDFVGLSAKVFAGQLSALTQPVLYKNKDELAAHLRQMKVVFMH